MTNVYPCLPMGRWTRFVLRHRRSVVAVWVVVLLAGGFASSRLSPLLSNTFAVPGTDSEHVRQRARDALRRPVRRRVHGRLPGPRRDATRRSSRGCSASSTAPRRSSRPASRRALTAGRRGTSSSATSSRRSTSRRRRRYTEPVLRALGQPAGRRARLRHRRRPDPARPRPDLQPGPAPGRVASRSRSRCSSCSPSSGSRCAVTIPFIFAACTITATLGIVYWIAHLAETPTYATNLVQLIGLGIAVDYSLLIVYRFREELARGPSRGRGGRADDGDRGPRGRLLRRRGRARARAARRDAAAVHADDGRRRLPDPDRLDRRAR